MNSNYDRTEDLQNTIEDIIEDVILLEAMLLRMEHPSPVSDFPRQRLEGTFHRVVSYLSQHAFDLHILTRSDV